MKIIVLAISLLLTIRGICHEPDTSKVNSLNTECWELRRQDPEKALQAGQKAIQLAKKSGYNEGLAFALKNTGVVYWIKGNYQNALNNYKQADSIFYLIENKTEIANIRNLYGLLFWNLGEYVNAIENYKNSISLYNETNDPEGEAKAIGNLGIIYYELGKYHDALENYLKALKIHESLNDGIAIANVYTNIGLIYRQQQKYNTALSYYFLSLKEDISFNNIAGQGNSYTNIGVCYFHLEMLDSSLFFHEKALKTFEQINDNKGISHSLNNIGEIYFRTGKYDNAMICYNKALDIKADIGDQQGEVILLLNKSRLLQKLNKYTDAIDLSKKALLFSELIYSIQYISESHHELANCYENLKAYEQSLHHRKAFSIYADSLRQEELSNKLLNLQVAYETDKKEQQIHLLNSQLELKESKNRLLYAGIGSLIIISSLIISRQRLRNRKNKKLLEAELERKELHKKILRNEIEAKNKELNYNKKELENYTLNLVEKNLLLEKLHEKIEELEKENPEDKRKLEKISQLSTSKIITENDWEKFRNLFEKVYEGFFYKLKEEFPGITTAEMRLAALIKLNLNSKEIASMIGISMDSVKKTRQRLRKKMALETEEGLDNRIQNLG